MWTDTKEESRRVDGSRMLHGRAVGLGGDRIDKHMVVRGQVQPSEAPDRVPRKRAHPHQKSLNRIRLVELLAMGVSSRGRVVSNWA